MNVHAEGWVTTSAGRLAAIAGIPGFDPRTIHHGQSVDIDGAPFTVRGVETRRIPDVTGRPFSLLVEDS